MAIFGKNKKEDSEKKDEKKSSSSSAKKKETMKDLYGGVKTGKQSNSSSKSGNSEEKKTKYNLAYKHLIRPLITEKAANLATGGKYVFEVSVESNKIEVAKSIEEIFGVKPIKVNILNIEGKRKVQGRTTGKRKDWRKAIITLRKGQTIDIYEGV